MRMFAQGSLLLIVVVSLASSLPQPFQWAKNKLFPGVPAPNPIPKISEAIPNVPGGALEKTGQAGVPSLPDIPQLNPLPINNAKDSLPIQGDLPINAPIVGDKPNLPDLGVPGVPSIPNVPGLNSLPVDAKNNLPLPNGDLPVNVVNDPIVPEVPGVPNIPEVPGLNTMPIGSLPLPNGDLPINAEAVGDKVNLPGAPDVTCIAAVPGVNSLPINNVKDNLPLPKEELPIYALNAVNKPAVPELGVPGSDKSLQLSDLNLRISKLEAVLKLEGRIQVVGDKIIASSGKEVDFATSKSICNGVGGQIAAPKNEKENAAVLAIVKKNNKYAYLGMIEGRLPGFFTYINGVPVIYTRWRKGEPSGKGKESCIEMYTDGQWNDKACNQKRLTVCEF